MDGFIVKNTILSLQKAFHHIVIYIYIPPSHQNRILFNLVCLKCGSCGKGLSHTQKKRSNQHNKILTEKNIFCSFLFIPYTSRFIHKKPMVIIYHTALIYCMSYVVRFTGICNIDVNGLSSSYAVMFVLKMLDRRLCAFICFQTHIS